MSENNKKETKSLEGEVLGPEEQNEVFEELDEEFAGLTSESEHSEQEQIEVLENLLPAIGTSKELVGTQKVKPHDPLYQYIKEISQYKLLERDEEERLIKQLTETGDIDAAKKLVVANLRLVVKIAMEYRNAYKNIMDLIQEGNIGLMKAVSKYNPEKGAKLSYYASWWIKSYILKFILDNFRLIKIGTTAEQKKLFYNLMREKERLMNQGIEPEHKLLSENLGVSEKAVKEMDLRLSSSGAEMSLDQKLSDDSGSASFLDTLSSSDIPIDDNLGHLESLEILEDQLKNFIEELKPRDKEIFKKRLLSEVPPSLQSIADDYGVSRERIRQIEARLIEKLKVYMSDYLG
ncbi:MAG: RNA polymerase subunit sigma-70 [Halobacteriovoraceae bacterium]|nr:RNA polymerase subunit sigma-70 [Halobacteriovoraceae bacterium]